MDKSTQELGPARFAEFGDPDYGYGDSVSTDNEIPDERVDDEILLWDSFKCTEPEPRSGSMVEKRWYEIMLRFIKAFLYGFLLLAILIGSLVSKVTALFAASQIAGNPVPYCRDYPGYSNREQYRHVSILPTEARMSWVWCVIFAFSIPECLDFVRFLWNCFFVDFKFPKARHLALLSCIEILQVAGVAHLFIGVLPNLDVVQAAASLSCVCIVPSVLGFISKFKRKQSTEESRFYFYGDVLAFLGQIGGLASFTYIACQSRNSFVPATLPVAFFLVSLRWWSNYVASDCRFGFIQYLAEARANLQAFRPVLIGYTSLLRITTFLLSALVITCWQGVEPEVFFKGFWMNNYTYTIKLVNKSNTLAGSEVLIDTEPVSEMFGDGYTPLYVLLIQALSGVFVYNCAKFACRTIMQGFGFALPLNLAVPTTVVSVWGLCTLRTWNVCVYHSDGVFRFLDHMFFNSPSMHDYVAQWYAWIWLIWFFSLLWITMHVWSTTNERLATTDRIFAIWSYESLMLDQSLALSRWRDEPDDDYVEKRDDAEEPMKLPKNFTSVRKEDHVTRIYACATMWHETPEEMRDFLNSILRMDRDQCITRILQKRYHITSPDYYELEVHIFFDDALKCVHGCNGRCTHDENKTQVNDWVVSFVKTVADIIRSRNLKPSLPIKYPTPYGGRLVWTLPENTKMYVHLKDKNRIRTRKRWSQVMYMYYLLGYRLMQLPIEVERKEVRAENTYILTLDGDIDFRPSAVKVLVDRMRVNKDLGSVCGRIHPLGTGPLVWFQKFEYAIGHWLQKSTEHTIGCVLCSPGCFALFRAKALMDYNVMRKYATVPKEARHFIQYDQGEDRWLCTLILQMGYKVEYSAASDAYTHAPESFNEFFIQRRRWIPSTVANIFDLLDTAKETKKANRDISWVYIFYQWILMGSTILGPGTIFLMLVGAFVAAFQIGNWSSFGYNLIPIFIFCVTCYFCKEKTQLLMAGVITAIYGLVMIVVLVGIMIQIAEDGWLAPSTLLFFVVAGELVITGLLHPLEWTCLLYGVIYYVTVPSMYMLLIIFSLFNMNNISWGTRDVPKPSLNTEEQQNKSMLNPPAVSNKREKAPVEFSLAGLFKCMLCAQEQPPENEPQLKEIGSSLTRIEGRLDDIERVVDAGPRAARDHPNDVNDPTSEDVHPVGNPVANRGVSFSDELDDVASIASSDLGSGDDGMDSADANSLQGSDNFLVSPNWLHGKDLGKGEVEYLKSEEEIFWKQFISSYLYPIDKDEKREAEIARSILDLRDQYVFKFFMINALFVLIVFLMQLNKDLLHFQWPLGVKYNVTYDSDKTEVVISEEYLQLEPIGCLFIIGFISVLFIQFVAMLFHRFDTFSHIMAKVSLDLYCCDKASDLSEEATIERHAEKIIKQLQRQVDGDTKSDHNSTVPPRKRMTIHQTIKGNDRRQPFASNFTNALERNLEDNGQNGSGGFISKRLSQTALRALQRRRTTILAAEKRQSQMRKPEPDNIYATANNPVNNERAGASVPLAQRRPTGILASYENPAFEHEEDGIIEESDRM
ncbi:chitin synthase chs-2 [Nasonia vitripennis]|uniref:chitin synthase n=1 Tax=Nasonia vitripennis TaxID=7425 RepID=A0A7M7H9L0_NASVI|nr:chitin synthase chs-2 [Nasonia vitripennis]